MERTKTNKERLKYEIISVLFYIRLRTIVTMLANLSNL